MRRILSILSIALAATCCTEKQMDDEYEHEDLTTDPAAHEMIVLGKKLDDPYSVKNVTKAIEALYPTKAGRVDIAPTHVYVRFLPASEEDYQTLADAGLTMMDHPLDYQILKDGDYYHDPDVSEDKITWQYAVVQEGFKYPSGIRYEILDDCYIPDSGTTTRASDGIDWGAVEDEAFRLTGNEAMLVPDTKAESSSPSGRIVITDADFNGGQPFGVSGVKVLCNSFVKFSSAYTDRDGYYEIPAKYSSTVRYRLLFKNEKGFAIGLNKVIVPASTSALGKSGPEGVDVTITSESDRKLFCRSVVNNAAYDYWENCSEDDLDITEPPKDLRIWLLQSLSASSTPMLHHGALKGYDFIAKMLGEYEAILQLFLPDITIGTKNAESYSDLYELTCHELSHASHYAVVGNKWWKTYIEYIVKSFLSSGGDTYGKGTESDAGYCAVGESWAYFLQSVMTKNRYGGSLPDSGSSFWFHPQIMRYLYERGMTVSQIFKALDAESTDLATLQNKLKELYPDKESVIDQVFGRYSE